jgi:hypothetical protein
MGLTDDVRAACEHIATRAQRVRIDQERLEAYLPAPVLPPPLDPVRHYLEGSEADVATYMLALDAINFGSGWFPTLAKRTDPATGRTVSGYFTVAWSLADRFRAHGAWTTAELQQMRAEEVADVLGQRPDHELMALYAQALRDLGRFLASGTALEVVQAARGSAERLAELLSGGMALFDDRGFFKRAQITGNDLQLAGVAQFTDLDRLTIFADNLVPHVLRCDGVLVYDDALAAHIDAGSLLPAGPAEREIRACALHACELLSARTGVPAHGLDMWLWTRGQEPEYKARPRHRTRSVYY